jgi:hypothetical protein
VTNDLEASHAFAEVLRILKPLSEIACAAVLSNVAKHYGYTIEEIITNLPPSGNTQTLRLLHQTRPVKDIVRTADSDTPYVIVLDQIDDKTFKKEPISLDGRRGIDFPCEQCGALSGSTLDDGWYRCHSCGYPSK